MPVNFNAMILPNIGTAMMEGDAARQNAMLKDQQMANSQQEMQFRNEERAYIQKQRAEDEAYLSNLHDKIAVSGGKMTPDVIMQLARSRNPQERAVGMEAMTRAQRLVDQRAAVEKLFPEPPTYTPTIGGGQFGAEPPQNYNALTLVGGGSGLSHGGVQQPSLLNSSPYRTRGEFRGAMANPERATAAMAAGMRTIPAALKDLLADPDTRAMALSLLEKEQKDIPEAKLITLRDSFPVGSKNYKQIDDIISIKGMPTQNVQVLPGVGVYASQGRVPLGTAPGPIRTGDASMAQRETVVLAPDGVTPIKVSYPGYSGLGDKDPYFIGFEKPSAAQTKATAAETKRSDSVSALKSQLEDIRGLHEDLRAAGGKPEVGGNIFSNAANQLAATTIGGAAATTFGSKQQPIRDTIKNSTLLLAKALANASGMTGKELDSNRDIQLLLSSLSTVGQSDQATNDTIDLIMKWVELNQKPVAGGGAAPTRPAATGGAPKPAGKPASTGVDTGHPLLQVK